MIGADPDLWPRSSASVGLLPNLPFRGIKSAACGGATGAAVPLRYRRPGVAGSAPTCRLSHTGVTAGCSRDLRQHRTRCYQLGPEHIEDRRCMIAVTLLPEETASIDLV
jgi:hypothetical protein